MVVYIFLVSLARDARVHIQAHIMLKDGSSGHAGGKLKINMVGKNNE